MSSIAAPSTALPLRERQLKLREDAILDATHALLARKGYEPMTMDDVAAEVGIAKGSLYKHFPSKEKLAAAVLTRLMQQAIEFIDAQPAGAAPAQRLRELLEWALRTRAAGGLPHLPATHSTLQTGLLTDPDYMQQLLALNARIAALIDAARAVGGLRAEVPTEVLMYSIYARSCDPTFDLLRDSGAYGEDEIVRHLVALAFDGLAPAG